MIILTDLRGDRKRRKREHRILLLGCGEAGKSTFIKQMRIIHSEGFGDGERQDTKEDMADNIYTAITTLMNNMTFAEEEQFHSDEEAGAAFNRIEAMTSKTVESVYNRADDIKMIWEHPIIQAVFSRRNQVRS